MGGAPFRSLFSVVMMTSHASKILPNEGMPLSFFFFILQTPFAASCEAFFVLFVFFVVVKVFTSRVEGTPRDERHCQ